MNRKLKSKIFNCYYNFILFLILIGSKIEKVAGIDVYYKDNNRVTIDFSKIKSIGIWLEEKWLQNLVKE